MLWWFCANLRNVKTGKSLLSLVLLKDGKKTYKNPKPKNSNKNNKNKNNNKHFKFKSNNKHVKNSKNKKNKK